MSRKKINTGLVMVPLASLVEDTDLYPRHAIDSTNVQSLVDALRAGATLPPIVADAKSKRITDGLHRVRAHRRVSGETAEVAVELIAYASEADMVLDATRRNITHGRRLDAVDCTRCVLLLRAKGVDDQAIADAMHTSIERVERLSLRIASAKTNTVPGTSKISLKRSVAHMAGGTLTAQQARAHASMPGTSFRLIAHQLRLALENDLCDLESESLVRELHALAAAIAEHVPAVEP